MRQAGRSLPEYRELRERHGFFEIAAHARALRRGDAAAGAPARRRRGRDVRGHHDPGPRRWAIDVELVEGVGPVVERADRDAPRTSSGCASPMRRRRSRRARGGADRARASSRRERAVVGFCGGPFTVAGYLVEGKPSRDFAHDEGADVPRAGGLARADGPARRHVRRYVAAKARAGADVIQLFDSWVGALSPADYEEFVAPYSARILARGRRADDPLRHRHRAPARRDGRGRRRRDRPRLAHPARPGLGRGRPDRGVQGNLDPARPARPVGAGRGGGARRPRARRRPAGPRLQPRPRRPAGDRTRRPRPARRARARAHREGVA